MLKRLSLFFICLILFASLAEAFHHHDDGAEHADCAVCAAFHHQADTGYIPPTPDVRRNFTETTYVRPVVTVITPDFFTPANNRAPPA